jgi:hypothetical protein
MSAKSSDAALPPDKLAYSISEACAATSLGTTRCMI